MLKALHDLRTNMITQIWLSPLELLTWEEVRQREIEKLIKIEDGEKNHPGGRVNCITFWIYLGRENKVNGEKVESELEFILSLSLVWRYFNALKNKDFKFIDL